MCEPEHLWFLNEYLENREYGGPEEGGWWYPTGTYVCCHGTFTERAQAGTRVAEMQGYLAEQHKDQHAPGSVLCDGWTTLKVERAPGQDFPTEPPVYA